MILYLNYGRKTLNCLLDSDGPDSQRRCLSKNRVANTQKLSQECVRYIVQKNLTMRKLHAK